MEAHFKRTVFVDEKFEFPPQQPGFIGWFINTRRELLPPKVLRSVQFPNYALGYKFEATVRELELIGQNQMRLHPALKLHDNFPALTFDDLLSGEFVPEVNPSQSELLQVESRVREAAFTWTLFFENLDPED